MGLHGRKFDVNMVVGLAMVHGYDEQMRNDMVHGGVEREW